MDSKVLLLCVTILTLMLFGVSDTSFEEKENHHVGDDSVQAPTSVNDYTGLVGLVHRFKEGYCPRLPDKHEGISVSGDRTVVPSSDNDNVKPTGLVPGFSEGYCPRLPDNEPMPLPISNRIFKQNLDMKSVETIGMNYRGTKFFNERNFIRGDGTVVPTSFSPQVRGLVVKYQMMVRSPPYGLSNLLSTQVPIETYYRVFVANCLHPFYHFVTTTTLEVFSDVNTYDIIEKVHFQDMINQMSHDSQQSVADFSEDQQEELYEEGLVLEEDYYEAGEASFDDNSNKIMTDEDIETDDPKDSRLDRSFHKKQQSNKQHTRSQGHSRTHSSNVRNNFNKKGFRGKGKGEQSSNVEHPNQVNLYSTNNEDEYKYDKTTTKARFIHLLYYFQFSFPFCVEFCEAQNLTRCDELCFLHPNVLDRHEASEFIQILEWILIKSYQAYNMVNKIHVFRLLREVYIPEPGTFTSGMVGELLDLMIYTAIFGIIVLLNVINIIILIGHVLLFGIIVNVYRTTYFFLKRNYIIPYGSSIVRFVVEKWEQYYGLFSTHFSEWHTNLIVFLTPTINNLVVYCYKTYDLLKGVICFIISIFGSLLLLVWNLIQKVYPPVLIFIKLVGTYLLEIPFNFMFRNMSDLLLKLKVGLKQSLLYLANLL